MVKRIFLLLTALVWFILPVTGFAAVSLFSMTVKSSQIEFGKPLYINLHTRYLQPSLSTLDLIPLNKNFIVDRYDDVESDSDAGQQAWRLRLYPRQPGDVLIPPLVFHGIKTKPLRITVTPSIEPGDGTPIQFSNEVGNTTVWVNQGVQITMQVETDSQYAWFDTDTAQQDGIKIVALSATHHSRVHNGVQRTQHRFGWVLYPQTIGEIKIQLPPLRYHRDGAITHRFYPPEIVLHVRALPVFVPPTMPVGRIQVDVSMPDHLFLVKRKLGFLSLRISSEGPPGQYASTVLRQFNSTQNITFYPPRKIFDKNSSQTGIGSESFYQIPFAAKVMGLVNLPSIRLQYFDTSTGKIETQNYSPDTFLAVGQWLVYAVVTILSLGVIVLLRFLYHSLKQRLQVYQFYRLALDKLQQAETPGELKSALMVIAAAECWATNLTLAMWLNHWSTRYPHLSRVSADILRLQRWLYGQTEGTVDEIRHGLIHICYRRMPLLKIRVHIRRGKRLN